MALHTCLRRIARANQALVKSGIRQAEAPFRQSERIYDPSGHRTIKPIASLRRGKGSALPLWFRKRELPAHSEAGTMATLIELASTPEIWRVKGFGGISNFTLFRMPSQPLTPLDVTERRNCPSCTTSIQPAADRLMVYLPGGSALLNTVKPEKVLAAGLRSGVVGRLASAARRRLMVAAAGSAGFKSSPDTISSRSGAVSAARSRSIGHLNLSQPLGSSAAEAGIAPSRTNAISKAVRMLSPPRS